MGLYVRRLEKQFRGAYRVHDRALWQGVTVLAGAASRQGWEHGVGGPAKRPNAVAPEPWPAEGGWIFRYGSKSKRHCGYSAAEERNRTRKQK